MPTISTSDGTETSDKDPGPPHLLVFAAMAGCAFSDDCSIEQRSFLPTAGLPRHRPRHRRGQRGRLAAVQRRRSTTWLSYNHGTATPPSLAPHRRSPAPPRYRRSRLAHGLDWLAAGQSCARHRPAGREPGGEIGVDQRGDGGSWSRPRPTRWSAEERVRRPPGPAGGRRSELDRPLASDPFNGFHLLDVDSGMGDHREPGGGRGSHGAGRRTPRRHRGVLPDRFTEDLNKIMVPALAMHWTTTRSYADATPDRRPWGSCRTEP